MNDSQMKYALENDDRVDLIPDAAGELITCAHHTERGVYLIVRDPSTDEIIKNACSYIDYRTLAALNGRQWPVTFIGGQRAIVEDNGDYYSVKSFGHCGYLEVDKLTKKTAWVGNARIPIDAPGIEDFFSAFLPSRNTRDAGGYPVDGTHWRYGNKEVYISSANNGRVETICVRTSLKESVDLKEFNKNYYPTRVSGVS